MTTCRMCETCGGRGTIDTSIREPHVTIHQAEECPDCDGSGWVEVNRIVVFAGTEDERALRIGRAVLASERYFGDGRSVYDDGYDAGWNDARTHFLAAGDDE